MRLRELMEGASARPWEQSGDDIKIRVSSSRVNVFKAWDSNDAALIVAAVNLLPELLAVREAAEKLSAILFVDDKCAYFMARNTDKQAGSTILMEAVAEFKAALAALKEKEEKG